MNLQLLKKNLERTFKNYIISEMVIEGGTLDFTIGNVTGWVTQSFSHDFSKSTVDVAVFPVGNTADIVRTKSEELDFNKLKEEIKKRLR